jgi:hypothetical protein
VKTPKGTTSFATWDGATHTSRAGKLVKAGPVPVLLRGSR